MMLFNKATIADWEVLLLADNSIDLEIKRGSQWTRLVVVNGLEACLLMNSYEEKKYTLSYAIASDGESPMSVEIYVEKLGYILDRSQWNDYCTDGPVLLVIAVQPHVIRVIVCENQDSVQEVSRYYSRLGSILSSKQ